MIILFITLASIPLTAALEGAVLLALYNWFVLPNFASMPHLGFLELIGISLLINVMAAQFIPHDDDDDKMAIQAILQSVIRSVVALATGAVIHYFA